MEYRIVCHHGRISGGPEAMHQLTQALVAAGHSARIVYVPIDPANRCHPRFEHYRAPLGHELPDRADHVLIFPETMTHELWKYRHARTVIWWLSVDNYFKTLPQQAFHWRKRVKEWWKRLRGKPHFYRFQSNRRLLHAHQSEYAREFLVTQGVRDSVSLTDYIAPGLSRPRLDAPPARLNQCLYNPLKGQEFTRRLIDACTDIPVEFVALQGLDEAQMQQKFREAKLYVDFGEHPGRDRIPREAALGGCVVVTGRLGSAGNDIDVPLPDDYKIDQQRSDAVACIKRLMQDVMADPGRHQAAQARYVEVIQGQEAVFRQEADAMARRIEAGA